ncbi:DNA-3-methyladenine glycosylase I [Emcibacter sp. SYSU 3D8]|uniref:DNA-3-methyladenine glycosylase I n=1 Tax=Emcibacter sp. SYSU 3D8 TaxID=3133969 RepID=UPI0031FE838F
MTEPVRCSWPSSDPLYIDYHDREWGVPERDSRALYEKLMLDGFQAGLAWITILRKRDNFRKAFDGFEPERIARYDQQDIARLLGDAGIIRHRGKIEGAITSARAYLEMREQGTSFSDYLWQFTGGKTIQNHWTGMDQVPTETAESRAMSKDLKTRGFKFCGPTICYAFMQAVGMVNDHTASCFRHKELS